MGIIREGQKVKIYLKLSEDSNKEFECFIKDVYPDRLSLIFPKEIMDYSKNLDEGCEVLVKIFTPSGIKVYEAMILNSPLDPEFVIEYLDDDSVDEVQRREYVRGQIEMKMLIEMAEIQRRELVRVPLETKLLVEREARNDIETSTIDLSGGGIKFFYEGFFEQNEPVSATLFLPEEGAVHVKGIILPTPQLQPYEHVLFFTEISESERDKIIKKCFEIQVA